MSHHECETPFFCNNFLNPLLEAFSRHRKKPKSQYAVFYESLFLRFFFETFLTAISQDFFQAHGFATPFFKCVHYLLLSAWSQNERWGNITLLSYADTQTTLHWVYFRSTFKLLCMLDFAAYTSPMRMKKLLNFSSSVRFKTTMPATFMCDTHL